MFYIEDNDEVALPKKYHRINNICAIVYDQLAEIIGNNLYDPLTVTHFKHDDWNKSLKEELEENDIHILDWLKDKERHQEISTVLTKHITMSILADFLQFIYESLSCARKGKMNVAYALLRKPLNDELLIFEQLLADSNEFIERFFHDGLPSKYDPSDRDLDKEFIIKSALNKIENKFSLDPDLIYLLRYDKTCEAGINGITNKALHIVTKDRNYKTPNQDLNLIFSQESLSDYYDHYYNFVPYLLIYSIAIIDELVFSQLPKEENYLNLKTVKIFKRILALIFISDETEIINGNQPQNTFDKIPDALVCKCENCGLNNPLNKADFKLYLDIENFICTKCFTPLLSSPKSLKPIFEFLRVIS